MKKILLMAMKLTKQKETSEVGLLLTDDQEIQNLNKLYRHVDSPTDVLAFSQIENREGFPLLDNETDYLLGDIVISVETANRQAILFNHSLGYELALLVVHGFLHLIGFDHISEEESDKMRALEKDVIGRFLLEVKETNAKYNRKS